MTAAATINLTEEQRQQLLDLLYRRFRKMNSNGLLELERLTRHPAELTGFQPVSSNPVVPKKEAVPPKNGQSSDVVEGVVTTPVNRREFLKYGAAGLLGAFLAYGWWQSDQNADNLSGILENVGRDATTWMRTFLSFSKMISVLGQE